MLPCEPWLMTCIWMVRCFRSSPKYVNKYPVVGEWGYGFGLRYKRSELLFGLHYMTKEYTQQESMQCVGVLQLRHTF